MFNKRLHNAKEIEQLNNKVDAYDSTYSALLKSVAFKAEQIASKGTERIATKQSLALEKLQKCTPRINTFKTFSNTSAERSLDSVKGINIIDLTRQISELSKQYDDVFIDHDFLGGKVIDLTKLFSHKVAHTVCYDPSTHPNEYYEQIKEERRLLREALIELGTKLNKKRKKLLKIIKRILKSTYSNNEYIDLRNDLRKMIRFMKPCLDDEYNSFNNKSALKLNSLAQLLKKEFIHTKSLKYEREEFSASY